MNYFTPIQRDCFPMDPQIKPLQKNYINDLVEAFTFPWTTKEGTLKKWETYFNEQENNKRLVLILFHEKKYVGYGSLIFKPQYSSFEEQNIPEINDLWVLSEYRNKKLATKLIGELEKIARDSGYEKIGLGVGLYKDYGVAQRLYVKLGYIPDGNGITYNYQYVIPGKEYSVDDALILWFTKNLAT